MEPIFGPVVLSHSFMLHMLGAEGGSTLCPRIAIVALVLAVTAVPGQAFGKSAKTIPAGELVLAGTPVRCGAARTVVTGLGEVAMTSPGYILLDPTLFSMPPAIQHFWYAHECAQDRKSTSLNTSH